MGVFNSILSQLPAVQINGQTLPPWMELAGLGLIIVLIMLSLLPRILGSYGKMKDMPGMGSGNDFSDEMPGGDYRP